MKDHFTYIEAYVKGKLSSEARQDFEHALAEDADLREAVDHYPKIEPILDLLIEEDIRAKMHSIRKENSPKIPIRLWSKIAASLLVLAVAMGWMWSTVSNSPARLYADFYNAPMSLNSRSGGNDPADLSSADQKYVEAHDLLKNNRPEAAELLFNDILTVRSKSENDAVEWYLVMTALKRGEKALARSRLKQILQQEEHTYLEKATQLDRRLSGFLGLGL